MVWVDLVGSRYNGGVRRVVGGGDVLEWEMIERCGEVGGGEVVGDVGSDDVDGCGYGEEVGCVGVGWVWEVEMEKLVFLWWGVESGNVLER